jgi:DNA repair photolyase
MEQKLTYKENAVVLLEKQLKLRAKKNQFGIIVLSSATDPYLQWENELHLTRQLLEVILHFRFPVHVITKSNLVVRDFDLLSQINKQATLPPDLQRSLPHKAMLTFSFSTLDDSVGQIFEPGATPPSQRLAAMEKALQAGLHTGVSLMPLLPLIGDSQEQLYDLYATFSKLGARYVFPASTTLFGHGPADSKPLTLRAVRMHYPERLAAFEKLFAGGFQIDQSYQLELDKRIEIARARHPLPDSII